jgi:hypothetical protein
MGCAALGEKPTFQLQLSGGFAPGSAKDQDTPDKMTGMMRDR